MVSNDSKKIVNSGFYYIKPAANHILTIGKGIIKDSYTAILELVKNAYDADAENVKIKLSFQDDRSIIEVVDDGHGMDYKLVTEKWMVPSTSDKIRQKRSLNKKRPLQGRKGIGRYAASILGNDLFLKTTDKDSLLTTELLIDWSQFSNDQKYLEDIDILIESYSILGSKPGTSLLIQGNKIWSDKELDELSSALKRLLSPLDEIDKDFKIYLEVEKEGSEKYLQYSEYIKPLPILEFYHYRLHGVIKETKDLFNQSDKVVAHLVLENNNLRNILPIRIEKEINLSDGAKFCGEINLDIRAFDLDENPVIRDNPISVEEAKKQLKELPGIAVIREGFRVRPYGDKKVDWLGLNERRYNNPTMRLSSNQVAGFANVLQEDESHLEEKATREGFKEDEYYEALKQCIIQSLVEIETLRYRYRKQHSKGGRKAKSISEQIHDLTDFQKLNNRLNTVLIEAKLPSKLTNQLRLIIEEESKEKEEQLEDIKKIIAQYEGQVTLGKIMAVVLHEGRKPLNALKQHPKFISEWTRDFVHLVTTKYQSADSNLTGLFDKIVDRLNDNKQQAEVFVNIFKKLEPLSNSKRPAQKEFTLLKPIQDACKLFESELVSNGITYSIQGDLETTYYGWEIDFYIVFANIIENSIYWLSDRQSKHIEVNIKEYTDRVLIDYTDSGPGLDEKIIYTQDIFDPGFSTKPEGTGLGLSIAGEALARNRGSIKALSNNEGVNFIIELLK
jgi:signal transduction histidine kinase